MYESAFNNLNSIYSNGNDNNNSEGVFDNAIKPDYFKGVSEKEYFNNNLGHKSEKKGLGIGSSLGMINYGSGMYNNNQESKDETKSIYLQNGELDPDKEYMGVLDRSRQLNESLNIDQTKQVSLQGRFTNTNTIEDLSLIGDRDSAKTLQGRRTNTNTIEDNSLFNDESTGLAIDVMEYVESIQDKKEKPKITNKKNLMIEKLNSLNENSQDIKNDEQKLAETIQHINSPSSSANVENIDKKNIDNYSNMDEEDDEENDRLKIKKKLERDDKNYSQDKYEYVSDDDYMSSIITHENKKTMLDYLSKY